MFGLTQPEGQTQLLRGKAPWTTLVLQRLPGDQQIYGYASFQDARDYLIETRAAPAGGGPVDSLYIHVLEGYREGEQSAIKSVTPLAVTSLSGPARRLVAVRLALTGGQTDTVIYQSEPGAVKLPDGTETDARYALLRQDAQGTVVDVETCRGTYLTQGRFSAEMPGDYTGTIVDMVGDLTGTRHESALILRPDVRWPVGTALQGKQLLVRVESPLRAPCNEGYRVQQVSALPGGLIRVDLQDAAPLAVSWHEVITLPADRPNVLRTNRPLVDHGNGAWYHGLKLWFPERNLTYTIKATNAVGGGHGGDTVELADDVNLAAAGVREGDWCVVYALQPGQQVTVPGDFSRQRTAE
jgi:hypothetical protein